MMRIALVGPLPPPSGGMANQTLQLARLLAQAGLEVETIQVNAPYRPAWAGRVKGLRALVRLMPYLVDLWRGIGRADVVHLMANSGWSWHLFAAPAIWLGYLRGKPVVVNYRGGYARDFLQRQATIVAFSLRRAARLVVPSGFLKEVFAEFSIPADILPNVVDLTRFCPSTARDQSAPVILVARNLEPIYDNATALAAFAKVRQQLPQARLVIAGSGPEEAALKQLADSLGISAAVEFTGRVDAENMPALYSRASVALNPSRVDNMPNSVLEALASAVPVVSTRVGGVPYIVQDGKTAVLVPPGDEEGMAKALLTVLRDDVLATSLAQAGLSAVQDYTWERVSVKLLGLYAALTSPSLAPINRQAGNGIK